MCHDETIFLDENGMPIASDVSKTTRAHRAALDRMSDQLETLAALHPKHATRLHNIAYVYGVLRTRLNSVEA